MQSIVRLGGAVVILLACWWLWRQGSALAMAAPVRRPASLAMAARALAVALFAVAQLCVVRRGPGLGDVLWLAGAIAIPCALVASGALAFAAR